jgi:hypothetical protein
MSFLNGNYATLTNLTDEALDRLISYRFSTMNISVHTTHRFCARNDPSSPRRPGAAAVAAHRRGRPSDQLPDCPVPGLNDGPELDRTLADLMELGEAVGSIALVPVGITRYRRQKKLYPLQPYSPHKPVWFWNRRRPSNSVCWPKEGRDCYMPRTSST